ncbi:MAG: hypothetical protein ACPIOQ_23005 [Promethearchaeia archaeon]
MGSGRSRPAKGAPEVVVGSAQSTPNRGQNASRIIEKNAATTSPAAVTPTPGDAGRSGAKNAAWPSAREAGDAALLFDAFRQVPSPPLACASAARPATRQHADGECLCAGVSGRAVRRVDPAGHRRDRECLLQRHE